MSADVLRNKAVATAGTVVLFWAAGAAVVAAVQLRLSPLSPAASVVLSVVVILLLAYAYMRVAGRSATLEQALFVGTAWTLLSIAAEISEVTHYPHAAYRLFGPPSHEVLRDVLLIAWIAAPALFARRTE